MRTSVLSLALLLFTVSAAFASFSGRVISVLDGDTIDVLHSTNPERIRLSGIDCPEKGQAFGNRAKQATSALVFGKDVNIQTQGHDKHGRERPRKGLWVEPQPVPPWE
jgi:micrococcal nuclease